MTPRLSEYSLKRLRIYVKHNPRKQLHIKGFNTNAHMPDSTFIYTYNTRGQWTWTVYDATDEIQALACLLKTMEELKKELA